MCVHAVGAIGVGGGALWMRHTGGAAVAPFLSGGDVLSCPLHATTGLWCPFCGGLRCVASLARGDVSAAASFNLVVLALVPVVAGWWAVAVWSAARSRPNPLPRVSDRGWLVLGAVLLVFTLWRNLPALPFAAYLAP